MAYKGGRRRTPAAPPRNGGHAVTDIRNWHPVAQDDDDEEEGDGDDEDDE